MQTDTMTFVIEVCTFSSSVGIPFVLCCWAWIHWFIDSSHLGERVSLLTRTGFSALGLWPFVFPFLGPRQLSLASEKVFIWVALNIASYLMKHPQNWSSSHRDRFLSPSPSLQPLSLHLCDCVVIHVIVVNTVTACCWLILACMAVRAPSCCHLWQDFHLNTGI